MKRIVILLTLISAVFACIDEVALPVKTAFTHTILNNDLTAPVSVKLANSTTGADTYKWTFQGGKPNNSNRKNPGVIVYDEPGEFVIKLEASNRDGSVDIQTDTISINPTIHLDFDVQVIENNFSPVEIAITNNTTGAFFFDWFFQGGSLQTSREQHPSTIVFTTPGEHTIRLRAGNGSEVHTLEKTVEVFPYLEANFDYSVVTEDDDFQIPVKVSLTNRSISATQFNWTFEGATINSSTDENMEITLVTPGTHAIKLKASNSKQEKEIVKTISVYENTNIRTFENLKLGINTAHNNGNIGAFFSAADRKVYTKNEVTDAIGSKIDIVYFGLNDSFTFNKFVSPDKAQSTAFSVIPNSGTTKIINSQEHCNCQTSMSVLEFDTLRNDVFFQNTTIHETAAGHQEFSEVGLPRIVLFETADQRKGAIKIKEFVKQGVNSYIVVDIKIQKEAK
ncbi:PKD domain-containing protein [Tenacibaculum sp. C7A-26P2]|uniref:PKD domain-containing protein n=1 Tax=Tenacibaculum sp. C7A-26P2 TaxID=3447504 RepID=UPI003F83C5C5